MTFAADPPSTMAEVNKDRSRPSGGRQAGLRILWLKTELLHPVDKGGKIRTFELLKRLKKHHEITYLTLDDGTATELDRKSAAEYCHQLLCIPYSPARRLSVQFYWDLVRNLVSRLPYAIARYRSAAFERKVADLARSGQFDVIVCDFLVQAVNVPADVAIPVVLFQHNVEAMIWERHALVGRNVLARLYFRSQWRRMIAFEKAACLRLQRVVAVSENDSETMRRNYGVANVAAIPTGVDTDYFRPSGGVAMEQHTMVFTGSMDWLPNDDAILFFLDEIFPLVCAQVQGAKLVVVGRDPSQRLREIAESRPGVVVTGRVPDVRPYLESAACFIVPIRIGGGTRLKIYEAMAMEKAVVSTTIGAEGLPVADGTDLLIADTPDVFAEALIALLRDPHRAELIGKQAARTVRESFGWERVAADFSVLLSAATEGKH